MAIILTAHAYAEPPTDRLVTAAELMRHPEWGPCELIRGKVVPLCRPNSQHGYLAAEIGSELRNFAKPRKLGWVFGDSGVFLDRDPDTVRGPDVYFMSSARCPNAGISPTFQDDAPDLCVEIVSPNDNLKDLGEKVEQFLAIGVKLVWVVYPQKRSVTVHRVNGTNSMVTS